MDETKLKARSRRRDFFILPSIVLATWLLLVGLAEISSRVLWPEVSNDRCLVGDSQLGHRAKPNCDAPFKASEGPWTVNHYNECGYRTDQPCGPRGPATPRLVMMGASFAHGDFVPYPRTIGAVLQTQLSRACHTQVQIENMALRGYYGDIVYRQLDEALGLRPDAVVYVVDPYDFLGDGVDLAVGSVRGHPDAQTTNAGWRQMLRGLIESSSALRRAKHYMYADSESFGQYYLRYGDLADFLRPPFTQLWRARLKTFDDLIQRMQQKISAQHSQLILVFVPSRAQAALLTARMPQSGVDPFAFGRALGEVAVAHQVAYYDASMLFARSANIDLLFYPADGHLTAEADPMIGERVASRVISDIPTFQKCQLSLSPRAGRSSDSAG